MSELMEKEQQVQMEPLETDAGTGGTPVKKKMSRRTRRRIIRWCVILVVLAVIGGVLFKLLGGKKSKETQVVTDVVQYGAITAKVEGSGLVKAKSSESISIGTPGTVLEVLVTEGQEVTAGTPLFTVDSPAAQAAVQKARSQVEGYEKQLSAAQKDIAARCRRAGKPFLVVTQLLHTMTEHPTPTRAEVLDVYNAVLDGASALMLTGETARGRYPVQAVRWLLDIARQAEEDQK